MNTTDPFRPGYVEPNPEVWCKSDPDHPIVCGIYELDDGLRIQIYKPWPGKHFAGQMEHDTKGVWSYHAGAIWRLKAELANGTARQLL